MDKITIACIDLAKALSAKEPWGLYDPNGDRSVVFRAAVFKEYHADIANILSGGVADQILYRLGLNLGKSAMKISTDPMETESEFWKTLTMKFQTRGWGLIVTHSFSDGVVRIEVDDSALAEVGTGRNTCHLLRGLFAGWLSAYGQVRDSKELVCRSNNSQQCKFVFTIAKKEDNQEASTIEQLTPLENNQS